MLDRFSPFINTNSDRSGSLVEMACRKLNAEMGMLSFDDGNRLLIAAQYGLPDTTPHLRDLDRGDTICQHVIAMGYPLAIEDALTHPLVNHSPFVTEVGVLSYLGHPIHDARGTCVGSVCVCNRRPHRWSTEDDLHMSLIAGVLGQTLIRSMRLAAV